MFKKKYLHFYLLTGILLIALFFRVYKFETFYIFEHDHDLYSWIVKDMLLDKHPRLIGQVTSIEGVFIGPFYYYLLTPFYFLSNMNPLSAIIPATIIGLFSVWSVYYIFSRLFNRDVGLIGSAIYAVSMGVVFFDRWVVPTQPTLLWCLWYLFILFSLIKKDTRVYPLIGFLIGFIWHIHVALLPMLLILPVAMIISKKVPTKKEIIWTLIIFSIVTAPFWLFEIKNNFIQTQSFLGAATNDSGQLSGLPRIRKIFEASAVIIHSSVFDKLPIDKFLASIFFIFLTIFCYYKKLLNRPQVILITVWIVMAWIAQIISKKQISEYYFANFTVLVVLIYSLVLYQLGKLFGKIIPIVLLIIYILVNIFLLITMPDATNYYLQKRRVIEYIKQDYQKNNYPCMSVNFIAKFGTGVGFRYLTWWYGMREIRAGKGAPVYNIVIPSSASGDEIDERFGAFGVILPKEDKNFDPAICDKPENQQIPLLGFTK